MADNVDHDTRTIDGKGTFHGMGMIAAFTPASQNVRSIIRSRATIADVRAVGQVEILPYTNNIVGNGLCYKKLSDFQYYDDSLDTDLLLKTTWSLRTTRPSWSRTMQLINDGTHPGKSVLYHNLKRLLLNKIIMSFLPVLSRQLVNSNFTNDRLERVRFDLHLLNVAFFV